MSKAPRAVRLDPARPEDELSERLAAGGDVAVVPEHEPIEPEAAPAAPVPRRGGFSWGSLFAAGETIYEIIVRGNKAVSPQMVTTAITLRTGDQLDPEEVARSIRQLYKMRMFADVRISTEPYRTGVNLIVDVIYAFLDPRIKAQYR